VSPCPTPEQNQRKPRRTAVVSVAPQTCALMRGRRCKPVRGLCEGPLSCYCLWFECVVGQGGRVLRCGPIALGGNPCPKSLMGSCAGGGMRRVRSTRERAAEARRLVSMSRPSFGGVGALRGGDHEHQHGQHGHEHLRQEGKGRSQLPSEVFYF
jgi:hypothetical protein